MLHMAVYCVYLPLQMEEDNMNEVPLSQCSKCDSEVPHDQIKWDMRYSHIDLGKALLFGIVIGGFLRLFFTWLML